MNVVYTSFWCRSGVSIVNFERNAEVYHLTFGDNSVRVLSLPTWNQLPETLKAKWFSKHFEGY